MVRCYSGETYSNGGRRNHITCKIHPLDSVRLTLNCEAGTLSLDVNGADQGVVFSNIPPDVHPAVCFYGITKSVRLLELKRVYGDSGSDASESEDESDGDEDPAGARKVEETVPPSLPDAEDVPTDAGVVRRDTSGSCKTARREQEYALAATIEATTAESPSTGLLACLANFAQWYVPRGQDDADVGNIGAVEQRGDVEDGPGERMSRMPDTSKTHAVLVMFCKGPGKTSSKENWVWSRRQPVCKA